MVARQLLTDSDRQAVRRVALFAGLPEAAVLALTGGARAVSAEGQTLTVLTRGDRADRFFVVVTGRVRLFVLSPQGRESVIEVVEPGQSFAEAAMFGNGRLPVNAEAEPGTRLIEIPAAPILTGIAEDFELARTMMGSLVRRQRQLLGRLGGFKVRSPGQRLAAALLDLTHTPDKTAENPAGNSATIALTATKAALAAHIGITPESLSRAMARLRELGVTSEGRTVTIADIARLKRWVEAQDAGTDS